MNEFVQKTLVSINALQLLKKHRMLNPITAKMLLSAPLETAQKIEQVEEIRKLFKSPFELPDHNVNGLIKFAHTENNISIGINPSECHFLIAGQTGCGKTTLMKIIFSQLLLISLLSNALCKSWIFVRAQDMRSLLKVNKNIAVIRFKEKRFNPLEPPHGVNPIDWANIFADIWIQAFRLYDASKQLLLESLSDLYAKFSQYNHYPSLFDLYHYIKKLKFSAFSRTARYQESLLNRITGLIHGSLDPVFDCSRGHTNSLINMNVIFELLYLTSEQQVFLVNYFLSYLYFYKIINKIDTIHFIGIDDGNVLFDVSLERRPDLGLPIIHQLLTTVRKGKIAIFACTQTPHQVGASIHSNSFAKIMFSLSNGKDIEVMQQSMGIKDPDQKAYCYNIPPREAVIKFSARYQKPFIARIPELNIGNEVIPDKFIIENNARLFLNSKIQPGFNPVCAGQQNQKESTDQSSATKKRELSEKTLNYIREVLLDIYNRFDVASSQRASDLGMSAETSNRIYRYIEKELLVVVVRLNLTGKLGGLSHYLVITEKGCEYIKKPKAKQAGRVGPAHCFIQRYYKKHLPAKGFKELTIEKNIDDKRIDLFGIYNNLKVAIQICISTFKTEHINIKKDLDHCDIIVLVCVDKKSKQKLEKELEGKISDNDKIKICVVHELLNDPEKVIGDKG